MTEKKTVGPSYVLYSYMLLFLLSGTVIYSMAGICRGCGGVGIYLVMVPYSQPNPGVGGGTSTPPLWYLSSHKPCLSSCYIFFISLRVFRADLQGFLTTLHNYTKWNDSKRAHTICREPGGVVCKLKNSGISGFFNKWQINFQRERRHLKKFKHPEENTSPSILREVEKQAKVMSS
jgi:hypothetical protein